MDSLIGLIVVLAIVFGFVEKFSKKAKANRSKSKADALTRPDRPMPFKARPQVNAPTAAHSDAEKIRQALKSLQDSVAPKEGASVKITRVPRQKKAATVLPQGGKRGGRPWLHRRLARRTSCGRCTPARFYGEQFEACIDTQR